MEDSFDDAGELDAVLRARAVSKCVQCNGLMVIVCDKCSSEDPENSSDAQCIRCGPEHDCGARQAGTGESPVVS